MSMHELEWNYEKARLEKVLEEIAGQLQEQKDSTRLFKKDVINTQKLMWEDMTIAPSDLNDLDVVSQAWQYQVEIINQAKKYQFSNMALQRLERMYSTPYFGRIDFQECGEKQAEQIYIGIASLIEKKTDDYLIYDWRAPVSSMFYDSETGRCSYKCPTCIIEGDLLLKRQYRITEGVLHFMFDSSLKIDDDILQELLSKSTDSKMKTIVTTIQREQNSIIRDDAHNLLIVQGAAGSGKTSIALHRIAYLLYRYRESVHAENIIIFSPNQIFNDYISSVLPELGEENMLQTTFREYSRKFLEPGMVQEDLCTQMEYLLTRRGEPEYAARVGSIRYKASQGFITVLKNYVKFLEQKGFIFDDVFFRGVLIVSKEELQSLFHRDYSYLSIAKRLDKIRQRIFFLLEPHLEKRTAEIEAELDSTGTIINRYELKTRGQAIITMECKPVREQVEKMTALHVTELYCRLFEDRELFAQLAGEGHTGGGHMREDFSAIGELTLRALRSGKVLYEDTSPLLFLNGAFGNLPNTSSIKHVLIDEAQDYTPLQYEIFAQLFPHSSMTLLGDLNQSIHPYMNVESYEAITGIFSAVSPAARTSIMRLTRSYRSTREIGDFCNALLIGADDTQFVDRKGAKPQVIQVNGEQAMYEAAVRDIAHLQERGCRSIAVICRTARQSRQAHEAMKKVLQISLIGNDDEEYTRGTVVVPSYLVKGLEFDAVLVLGAGEDNYRHEEERRLFYTACTRALHELHIYCEGKPNHFITAMDVNLYDTPGPT